MKCYLCGSSNSQDVKGEVRDNPSIKIKKCQDCSLVYLDTQSHITENFYQESGMEKTNVCISVPSVSFTEDTEKRFKLHSDKLQGKRVLDFGCGSGDFLFKLKKENISKELCALELNKQHEGFLSENFQFYSSIEEIPDNSLDFITMFHVLEHLKDPITELNNLYLKLKKSGQVIIEVPNADDALLNLYDCDAFSKFTYWSCHLYLFTNKTLEKLIQKTSFEIENIRQFQRYNLANHLHWLSKGLPGGHVKWTNFNSEALHREYERALAEIGQCDTIIANIKK